MKITYKKDKKNEDKKINFSLFSVKQFLYVFALFGFVITVSFFLFFNNELAMAFEGIELEYGIKERAIQNFLNVIFLSLTMSIIYNVIKYFTIKIPVVKILDATHRITKGDFSARIYHKKPIPTITEFDVIIQDFNKMAEELSGIETLKTDFISNVSHELKTPLSVIQNYSTMLQNPSLSEEERIEYARILNSASANLSELITSILRLNKLENQQIFPQKELFNLGENVCECMLQFEKDWEEKKLNIETDIEEDVIVDGDISLLSMVWSNLISNAIKFTDEGDTVSVSVRKDGKDAVVEVSDTGCGMTPEVAERIFEKFYQGDTSRATKGNGLGLALVKRVIDITDGEIKVESEEGVGTTFSVKIPA